MFPDPETYYENIVKIVQMASDVQQEFYEAMRIHFMWEKKQQLLFFFFVTVRRRYWEYHDVCACILLLVKHILRIKSNKCVHFVHKHFFGENYLQVLFGGIFAIFRPGLRNLFK